MTLHREQKSILHRIQVLPQERQPLLERPLNPQFRQYLLNLSLLKSLNLAPVAKLDKAPVYETGDYRFESCRARQLRALNLIDSMI